MSEFDRTPLIVFGGTFDPVHIGHLQAVTRLCESLSATNVIWLPVGEPPHRSSPIASAQHRVAMLQLAIAAQPLFTIDAREINRVGPSYSILTLSELRAEHPHRTLCLAVGLDAALNLPSWHRWEEIFDLAGVAVMHRPGWTLPNPLPDWWRQRETGDGVMPSPGSTGWIKSVEVPPVDVSSADIRSDLAKKKSVEMKVPLAIAQYIREHQLYE